MNEENNEAMPQANPMGQASETPQSQTEDKLSAYDAQYQAAASQPATAQPATDQPASEQPEAAQPVPEQAPTAQPASEQPATPSSASSADAQPASQPSPGSTDGFPMYRPQSDLQPTPTVAQAAPATQTMQSGSAPSAIPALVCGILSIVLFFFTPISLILGIVAIVLASSYFKNGGTEGTGKGARVCGIIGTILSALMLISYIFLFSVGMMVILSDDFPKTSSSTSSSYSYEDDEDFDEEAIVAPVEERLKQIKDRDPQMMQEILALAEQSLQDELDYLEIGATFETCGIDPNEYLDLVLDGFDYEFLMVDDEFSDDADYAVEYTITSKDMAVLTTLLSDAVDQANASGGLVGSDAEMCLQVGSVIMDALRNTPNTKYNFFDIDVNEVAGKYVIDEESWTDELEYYFTLS